MKHLLALAALLFAFNAQGATYYFSDCQTGVSHIDCVPGVDENATDPDRGLSPSKPFKTFTRALPGGSAHTRLYAKGGAWVLTGITNLGEIKTGTAAIPNVWSSYTPSWGGTAKPIVTFIKDASNGAGFNISNGGLPSHKEGYTLRGIEFRGPGYRVDGQTVIGTTNAGTMFSISNDTDHVILDDLVITGFGLGVSLSGTQGGADEIPGPLGTAPGTNHKNEYITLKNSHVYNNKSQGWLGGGWYVLVENNRFENNGFGRPTLDHNIYIENINKHSGYDAAGNLIPYGGSNMTFRGNWMTKASYIDGKCSATSMVGHYEAPGVVIENNTVYEPSSGSGCFGIQMNVFDSSKGKVYNHVGTVIRGNRVILGGTGNAGAQGISINGCKGCLVENNVVVRTGTGDFFGILVPEYSSLAPNGPDGDEIVRNNSIYIDNNTGNTYGIRSHSSVSTGESIVNNLIVFGPATNVNAKCFSIKNSTTTRTAASYNAFDKNICHRVGGANVWNDVQSTLAAAQAAGFDPNSSTADPLLVAVPSEANNYSMALQSGSPAINAGHATLSSRRAIDSKIPIGARDIGAHDFGATAVAPATPTRLQIN